MSTEETTATAVKKSLKYRQVIEAIEALRKLDEKDGHKPVFQFDPGVRVALARRLRRLVEISEDIDAARKDRLTELGISGEQTEDGKSKDDPNAVIAFQKWWSDFMESTIDAGITLDTIQYKWMLGPKDKNELPITVLTALDPFLVGLPEDPA